MVCRAAPRMVDARLPTRDRARKKKLDATSSIAKLPSENETIPALNSSEREFFFCRDGGQNGGHKSKSASIRLFPRGRAVCAHHVGRGGDLAVDLGNGLEDAETHLRADELAFDHKLIAGLNDALEARVVDAGKVEEAVLRIDFVGDAGERNDGAGLSHRLDDEHARHDGHVREVPRELRFVGRHILDRHDGRQIVGKFDHPVDQKKGKAMRKHLHDFLNVQALRHSAGRM